MSTFSESIGRFFFSSFPPTADFFCIKKRSWRISDLTPLVGPGAEVGSHVPVLSDSRFFGAEGTWEKMQGDFFLGNLPVGEILFHLRPDCIFFGRI